MDRGDILIRGGLVIDPSSGIEGKRNVLIRDGKVAAVTPPSSSISSRTLILEARGCWVMPGVIDLHVHLREPGREADETILSGTRAAARGGVTSVVAMPNTNPTVDNPAMIRLVRAKARADASVNVLVCGAVTVGQKGNRLTSMRKMAQAGAVAFSDDGYPVMDARLMRRALENSRSLCLPVLDHAEDFHLTDAGVMHEGRTSRRKGLPGIPASSEVVMAMRDIGLAEATGGHLHLCHVSCAGTVEIVRQAKKRGVRVTAEAAPHHFTLTDADIPEKNADFKMKPPLRAEDDREAIIRGLSDGTIDAIATDHAPHSPKRKALGMLRAPFGVIGLETLLPLSLALVERRRLSRSQLVDKLSTAPARILGLRDKGNLRPGSDGDITVLDPNVRYILGAPLASKSRNSPFLGWRLKGAARATIVGGRLVYAAGAYGALHERYRILAKQQPGGSRP